MKKIILVFVSSFLLTVQHTHAQSGLIKESLKVKSTVLGKEVEYSLYLPPDYDKTTRRYPVLYLLHGFGDDETGWTQFGEVKAIADQQLQKNLMTEMIIVTPDAGTSWYINSYDGKVKYEDFFINEFIPHIDATFRTRAAKRFRGLAGLSMGGHGSLIMAMKHPELFSTAAPLSTAIYTKEETLSLPEAGWNRYFEFCFGTNIGVNRINDHYNKNWILSIVENGNAEELKKVKYYIDCGDKDSFIKGNMALHALLIDKKIPHEFRVREGVHNWDYWRTALPEVLKFVSASFH
ncbi:MAG TPA: alpha/beta hydrolase-fold protein [Cyclobacteriaceae bacterium]|nr:alpha/beta hydrolase-fold protein [Cyclobacteriaceae bacterium]